MKGLKRVFFDYHASKRMLQRGLEFNLDICDTKQRIYETVLCGIISRAKNSRKRTVFYKYFNDNISFFVFCKENKRRGSYEVKSVIIQEGRE